MSDSDDGDFVPKGVVVIPPAYETPERLKEEIARLQAEVRRLKAETCSGAAVLEQTTVSGPRGLQ